MSSTLNTKPVCKSHKITIDVITKSYDASIINCVNCKKEKQAVFIADTGASATFTFDKSDFTTYIRKTTYEKFCTIVQKYFITVGNYAQLCTLDQMGRMVHGEMNAMQRW
jgi:hypothetical protein